MICRGCGYFETLDHLWDVNNTHWRRCPVCGSDTTDGQYIRETYTKEYLSGHPGRLMDQEFLLRELTANFVEFDRLRSLAPNNDFLDVGHCEGTALTGMAARGWSVHGFDIHKDFYLGPHTTIASDFKADLWPYKFGAVLCREVIEHVPVWTDLLTEIQKVMSPGGILNLQTPRPMSEKPSPLVYGSGHLVILSPLILLRELTRLDFSVLNYRYWDTGHFFTCRKA